MISVIDDNKKWKRDLSCWSKLPKLWGKPCIQISKVSLWKIFWDQGLNQSNSEDIDHMQTANCKLQTRATETEPTKLKTTGSYNDKQNTATQTQSYLKPCSTCPASVWYCSDWRSRLTRSLLIDTVFMFTAAVGHWLRNTTWSTVTYTHSHNWLYSWWLPFLLSIPVSFLHFFFFFNFGLHTVN